jgi:hypothetical protein
MSQVPRAGAAVLIMALLLSGCRSATNAPPVAFDPLSLGPAGAALKKFLERPLRKEALWMKARFQAVIPNMKKEGVMQTERVIDASGHNSFEMKSYQGDDTIKKQVIARYIGGLQDNSTTAPPEAVEISPRNYKIKYKRAASLAERPVEIFELTPKRSALGLFKGEIWLDPDSGLPLRTTGRFVRNPSVIFKSVDFTQDFVLKDGRALESELSVDSNTRVVGRVQMLIRYTDHEIRPAAETKSSTSASR